MILRPEYTLFPPPPCPTNWDHLSNSPYDPSMMVKVLIYGYATGVFWSRKIAKKVEEDVGVSDVGGRELSTAPDDL